MLDAERLEDAVQFRTDFGLEAEASAVASTFGNDAYSDADWGVPLSAKEREDLVRRTVVREAIQPAAEVAVKSPGYAGIYIDQKRGGVPVFVSTEPNALASTLGAHLPAGVRVPEL